MSSGVCWRTTKGWLAGCVAATAVIGACFGLSSISDGISTGSMRDVQAFAYIAGGIFVFTSVLSGIPAAIVIWLSERFKVRSILFFGCAGAVIGFLSERVVFGLWPSILSALFVAAGFGAGAAYWWIAGRQAGRNRDASAGPV